MVNEIVESQVDSKITLVKENKMRDKILFEKVPHNCSWGFNNFHLIAFTGVLVSIVGLWGIILGKKDKKDCCLPTTYNGHKIEYLNT